MKEDISTYLCIGEEPVDLAFLIQERLLIKLNRANYVSLHRVFKMLNYSIKIKKSFPILFDIIEEFYTADEISSYLECCTSVVELNRAISDSSNFNFN